MNVVIEEPSVRALAGESALLVAQEAQMQAVLAHPEVAADARCCDAAFDLLALLRGQGSVAEVARSFGALRQACGERCYLPLYRMRRWLERTIEVRAADGAWEAISLQDADFDRAVRRLRARAWEMDLAFAAPDEVPVAIRWRPVATAEAGRP